MDSLFTPNHYPTTAFFAVTFGAAIAAKIADLGAPSRVSSIVAVPCSEEYSAAMSKMSPEKKADVLTYTSLGLALWSLGALFVVLAGESPSESKNVAYELALISGAAAIFAGVKAGVRMHKKD
jgi:hypothetical protein